ncbi:alpha/beta hydrolase [Bifidobacterium pullorum subsp. saeculare]|uniref:Alpha/beta hydrolase n=1 Tax=Bifidobacterium pullorum subsp. saeculare TaxID=78257 RepID=A0A939B978_9BIFI|nr:alpha/beta hydrolase [Bifidobacterium pullorum]MBM6699214.1 alpha/beta hydrolase [Bifidobacterium pullorum subsp. saeculare]
MNETSDAQGLDRFLRWTEIDGDLDSCDPDRARIIKAMRMAFATGDELRAERWEDPAGVDVFEDIPYAQDGLRGHLLDLYLPHDARLRGGHVTPVYVDIHGGGFVYGYKELNRNFCTHLAAQGVAVFSLNYRPAPQADFRGQLEDIATAMTWIAGHIGDYPVDGSGVFVTGDSAGGCLALFACLCARNPEFAASLGLQWPALPVKGAVFESGVFEVAGYADGRREGFEGGDIRNIIGPDFFAVLRQAGAERLTCDALAALDVPPMMFVTSGDDFIQSETLAFAAALARLHKPFELYDWPIAKTQALGHVFPVCMTWLDESQEVLERMATFACRYA